MVCSARSRETQKVPGLFGPSHEGNVVKGTAHGSVTQNIVRARDIIVQFGLQTTPATFRGLVRRFLQAYLGTPDSPIPFGGRSAQLDELNCWLRNPSASANLLITAPAGRGKTALLVRWISEMEPTYPPYPVVFVPISIRYETNRAEVFYSAVAAGLAGILEQTLPTPAADPASFFRDKVVEYLDLFWEKHQPCLLVIDGLDEATGWKVDTSVLPLYPAPGLRIVASALGRGRLRLLGLVTPAWLECPTYSDARGAGFGSRRRR
jgi:NACHT domain